jgi:HD-GYP domain-containing protein (c-di-GMP phosphodiesterase class II)
MVEFRNLENRNPEKEGQKGQTPPKVSFSQLASDPDRDISVQDQTDQDRKILYEKALDYCNQVFDAVKRKRGFALEPGYQFMRKMVEIQPSRDVLFITAIHLDDRDNFILNHSVNVAIFAFKIGANLGFSKDQQVQIGMTALLHDIGTALIPDRIINKEERLSEQEFKILKERPQHSYKILRTFGEEHAYLSECAVQVYERIDGSGYPQGLKGEEIHEYAQIIGLVDMYEALIHSRPQREKRLHFSAIKEIIQTSKNCFQRKHLKVLLSIFSIFPIYSYVKLNSDAIGKVIETYPDQPMRPKLQIIYDSQKRPVLTERIVNLPDHPLLYIVDSVSEEELKKLSGI